VVTFSGTIDDRDSHIERGVMAARVFEGSGLALSLPEEVWALKPNSNPIVIGGEPMVVDLDGDTRRSARARIQAEQAATRAAEEAAAARADASSRREGELAKLRSDDGSTTPPPKKRGKEDDENDRDDGDSGSKDGKVPSVALQPGQYVEQPDGKGGVKVSLIASEARKYGWTATASATKQVRAGEVKVLSPTTGKSRYDARMLLLLEEKRVLEEARKETEKATQATNERKEKRRQERKMKKQEKDQLAADEESARQAETAAKAQARMRKPKHRQRHKPMPTLVSQMVEASPLRSMPCSRRCRNSSDQCRSRLHFRSSAPLRPRPIPSGKPRFMRKSEQTEWKPRSRQRLMQTHRHWLTHRHGHGLTLRRKRRLKRTQRTRHFALTRTKERELGTPITTGLRH
jgi:hypothetical protein